MSFTHRQAAGASTGTTNPSRLGPAGAVLALVAIVAAAGSGGSTVAAAAQTSPAARVSSSHAPAVPLPDIFAQPDVIVGEADGVINLTVSLSAPGDNPASVNYATANS